MDSTSVETHTFYVFGDNGYIALAQLIYSNVAYVTSFHYHMALLMLSKWHPNNLPIQRKGLQLRPFQAPPLGLYTPQQP
jgi:hypothetical protein